MQYVRFPDITMSLVQEVYERKSGPPGTPTHFESVIASEKGLGWPSGREVHGRVEGYAWTAPARPANLGDGPLQHAMPVLYAARSLW